MPSIIPKITTEDPDFQQAINYHLHFSHKYTELGRKFCEEQIAANQHLTSEQLKKQIESNMYQFIMSIKSYLDQHLKD